MSEPSTTPPPSSPPLDGAPTPPASPPADGGNASSLPASPTPPPVDAADAPPLSADAVASLPDGAPAATLPADAASVASDEAPGASLPADAVSVALDEALGASLSADGIVVPSGGVPAPSLSADAASVASDAAPGASQSADAGPVPSDAQAPPPLPGGATAGLSGEARTPTFVGETSSPAPAPAQAEGEEAPSLDADATVPSADGDSFAEREELGEPVRGRSKAVVLGKVLAVLVAVLGVAGLVGYGWSVVTRDREPEVASAGECLVGQTAQDMKIVRCDDATAQWTVVGRVDGIRQKDFLAAGKNEATCDPWKTTAVSYWTGEKNGTGHVLCLEPIKKK
ncbi:hypothetical protein SAMN05421812_12190 [Asanoa hainanensis]|uniref:Uncharacterized protein n=1 Tax=Asanoa hainanensis TaxID=560556 RepID=A0A239PE62_9ACTN|nr:hypothetical protein [Asanoa hainanensis]SNT65320.1 hypothetical protein SAMN05421812_12190 [Asanoa hainanensis]